MKAADRAVARRYAEALLDVAEKGPPGPQAVRAELRAAAALLATQKELAGALALPVLGPEGRKKLVAAIWTESRASALMRRLLELLASRDRLALLPAIESSFSVRWNERRGVEAAEAVSAAPLDAGQRGALAAALKTVTGREIELEARVDPGVLGGLRVTLGGRTYDGTVRTQLAALRRSLGGEA